MQANRLAQGAELVATGAEAAARRQRVGELGETELLPVEDEGDQRERRKHDPAPLQPGGERFEVASAPILEGVHVGPGVGKGVLAPPDVGLAARLRLERDLASVHDDAAADGDVHVGGQDSRVGELGPVDDVGEMAVGPLGGEPG